jgi:hypothetical protein
MRLFVQRSAKRTGNADVDVICNDDVEDVENVGVRGQMNRKRDIIMKAFVLRALYTPNYLAQKTFALVIAKQVWGSPAKEQHFSNVERLEKYTIEEQKENRYERSLKLPGKVLPGFEPG